MTDTAAETISGDQGESGGAAPEGDPGPAGEQVASVVQPDVGPVMNAAAQRRCWGRAAVAASGVGLPIGWLLCYGGLLPFFLGLFYFLLFGLLLGAVAYRVGAPARPLSRAAVVGGTAVVVLVAWGTSFLVEAHDFPGQVADVAIRQTKKLPQGMPPTEYRQRSAESVRDYLRESYAPGGAIGYARWALTTGRVNPPAGMLLRPFKSSQPPFWWGSRVVLSIIMLFSGVYSQVAPLRRLPTQDDREGTAVNPLSKI